MIWISHWDLVRAVVRVRTGSAELVFNSAACPPVSAGRKSRRPRIQVCATPCSPRRPQIIAQQARRFPMQHPLGILHDIKQTSTQHRQSPGLSREEEPRPCQLLVTLGGEVEPEEMTELTKTEKSTINPEQRT